MNFPLKNSQFKSLAAKPCRLEYRAAIGASAVRFRDSTGFCRDVITRIAFGAKCLWFCAHDCLLMAVTVISLCASSKQRSCFLIQPTLKFHSMSAAGAEPFHVNSRSTAKTSAIVWCQPVEKRRERANEAQHFHSTLADSPAS